MHILNISKYIIIFKLLLCFSVFILTVKNYFHISVIFAAIVSWQVISFSIESLNPGMKMACETKIIWLFSNACFCEIISHISFFSHFLKCLTLVIVSNANSRFAFFIERYNAFSTISLRRKRAIDLAEGPENMLLQWYMVLDSGLSITLWI